MNDEADVFCVCLKHYMLAIFAVFLLPVFILEM